LNYGITFAGSQYIVIDVKKKSEQVPKKSKLKKKRVEHKYWLGGYIKRSPGCRLQVASSRFQVPGYRLAPSLLFTVF